MFDQMFTQLWSLWADLVGGLGLPMDRHTSAYFCLVLLVYGIGRGFKSLAQK